MATIKLIPAGVLMTALAGCAGAPVVIPPPPAQPPDNDGLVVPGQRIGPVAIGMTTRQLLEVMGSPGESHDFYWGCNLRMQATENVYASAGLTVTTGTDNQQVMGISAYAPSGYRTKEGVGLGATRLEIQASLGAPDMILNRWQGTMFVYRYNKGLSNQMDLSINGEGRVQRISVYPQGFDCNGT